MFWLTLILLSLLFSVWVLGPWLWRYRQRAVDQCARDVCNLKHYQAEMQSLSKRLAADEISQEEFSQFKADLSLAVLADVPDLNDSQTAVVASERPAKPPAMSGLLFIFVLFIGGAFFGYQRLGAYNEIQLTKLLDQSAQRPLSQTELTEVFSRIEQALQRSPNNVELRFIAARMHFAQGDYPAAVTAFEQVVEQLPDASASDKAMALAQLAQADFFVNEQHLSTTGREALQRAIALNPQERTALGLLGIDAFANGQYREAIGYWRRLQSLVGPGNNALALENGVQKAIERLQDIGEDVSDLSVAKDEGTKLAIQVSIAPEWAEQLQGTETLFVYAKPEGQSMPVAAKKIAKPQFPLSISLSDLDSPMPTARLSQQQRVVVTARLSRSGNVTPASGDLEGRSQEIRLSQHQELSPVAIDLLPIR